MLKKDANIDSEDTITKIFDLALDNFNYEIIDIMIKKGIKLKEGVLDKNKEFLLLCYISNAGGLKNFIENKGI